MCVGIGRASRFCIHRMYESPDFVVDQPVKHPVERAKVRILSKDSRPIDRTCCGARNQATVVGDNPSRITKHRDHYNMCYVWQRRCGLDQGVLCRLSAHITAAGAQPSFPRVIPQSGSCSQPVLASRLGCATGATDCSEPKHLSVRPGQFRLLERCLHHHWSFPGLPERDGGRGVK